MIDPITAARLCAAAYLDSPDLMGGDVARAIIRDVDGAKVAAFRGTDPCRVLDDLADLDLGPLVTKDGHRWHRGFAVAAVPVVSAIPADIQVLAGHSLGAAIAINVAVLSARLGLPMRAVYGFGCPRTAIGPWQREVLAAAGTRVFLWRHRTDPVTHVPVRADAIPNLAHLLPACQLGRLFHLIDDWQHAGDVTQLGEPGGLPSIEHHAIGGYIAAFEAQPVPAA